MKKLNPGDERKEVFRNIFDLAIQQGTLNVNDISDMLAKLWSEYLNLNERHHDSLKILEEHEITLSVFYEWPKKGSYKELKV